MNTYRVGEVCAFSKAKEQWGGFGNMSGGYPLRLVKGGILIPSSEHLYQCMRFSYHPNIQQEILSQGSGMGAKMGAKKYRLAYTRIDFEANKLDIMMWCLRIKASQHKKYRDLLLETGDRSIVEISKKDQFWGAKMSEDGSELVGHNALGQLHEDIRDMVMDENGFDQYKVIEPVGIPNFSLLGVEIGVLDFRPK